MDLNRPDFEEFIGKLSTAPIEEIVDTVAGDYDLRDYLAACAGNYRNGVDYDEWNFYHRTPGKDYDFYHFYENTQCFKDWTWKDYVKFSEEADRKHIAHWAPYILRALYQRMNSEHAKAVQKEHDRKKEELEKKAQEERTRAFMASIPKKFREASYEKLDPLMRGIADKFEDGGSFILYSSPGVGKTYLAYAIGRKLIEEGRSFKRFELSNLMQRISKEAMSTRYTANEIIDMDYVKSCEFLVIDECDKVPPQDTAFRNFSYLVDKRSEELLPTILMCNAANAEELVQKLGPSICDRFTSKQWKAKVAKIERESLRGKEAI